MAAAKEQEEKLNEEIETLTRLIREQGLTVEEIDEVLSPLMTLYKRTNRRLLLRKALKLLSVVVVFVALMYFVEPIRNVVSLSARLFLIKLLRFWDWTRLYHKTCLLENPLYIPRQMGLVDCQVCESVDHIIHIPSSHVTSQQMISSRLMSDEPFIIDNGANNWPTVNNDDFGLVNATQYFVEDDRVRRSVPCHLSTNLRMSTGQLGPLLQQMTQQHSQQQQQTTAAEQDRNDIKQKKKTGAESTDSEPRAAFVHWENCEREAVKSARRLFNRPWFIPNWIGSGDTNWVFVSDNYRGRVYKEVPLTTKIFWMAQVKGHVHIRLRPSSPCTGGSGGGGGVCDDLEDTLHAGDVLVMSESVWKFDYLPGDGTENIGVAAGGGF